MRVSRIVVVVVVEIGVRQGRALRIMGGHGVRMALSPQAGDQSAIGRLWRDLGKQANGAAPSDTHTSIQARASRTMQSSRCNGPVTLGKCQNY